MRLIKILIALVIVCVVTGCSQDGDVTAEREKALTKLSDEIVVGVAWPFAERNDGFREGLELALEEINQTGINGKHIKLVQEDDDSSVTDGLSIAQSFSNNLNMTAVIGHRGSSVTVPVSKVYDDSGLLMLAPLSTSPKLTEAGGQLVFRLIPNDIQLGQEMADYAQAKGYKNIVIFYENDEYGRGLANSFEDSAKENNLQIIDRISDYKDSLDLQRLVNKWKLLDCDAVFIAQVMPSGADFIVQLRAAGLEVPLMGGDGLDSEDLLNLGGKAAEGAVIASIFNPRDPDEIVRNFVEAYQNKYGEEPHKYAAQAYDSLQLLAAAVAESGSNKPAELAAALQQKTWQGVSGTRAFDTNGDVREMPIVLKQVVNGQFEYLD